MTQRNLLIAARFFFGGLSLVAVGTQFVLHVRSGYDVLNFFSYFTNLSNIFAAVVFIVGAVFLLQQREPTANQEVIRGASVVAMAVVGVVFSVLLSDTNLGGLLPWVNFVVHYLFPVVVVADWLFQPPKTTMGTRQIGLWLIYPALYLVYTLIRGPLTSPTFYPYPFLNAAKHGYGSVAAYSVGIFVLFLAFGGILAFLGNRLQHRIA